MQTASNTREIRSFEIKTIYRLVKDILWSDFSVFNGDPEWKSVELFFCLGWRFVKIQPLTHDRRQNRSAPAVPLISYGESGGAQLCPALPMASHTARICRFVLRSKFKLFKLWPSCRWPFESATNEITACRNLATGNSFLATLDDVYLHFALCPA